MKISRFQLILPVVVLSSMVYPPVRLFDWLISRFDPGIVFYAIGCAALTVAISRSFAGGNNPLRWIMVHWLGMGFIMLGPVLIGESVMWLWPSYKVAVAVAVVSMALIVMAVLASHRLHVKHHSLVADHMPHRLRLVQISDVHIGSRSADFLAHVVRRINALSADLVVITGDLVDSSSVDRQALSSLADLDAKCFFVAGNHDRWSKLEVLTEHLQSLGVTVLRNEAVITRDIQLIGIDDAEDARQVARTLPGIEYDAERFCVLLYHRPHGWEDAMAAGIDLKLSGHTHNGQIFPFNLLVRRLFPRIQGLFEQDGRWLYVSPGTGTWGPMLRLGSRNEITCFDLQPVLNP